MSSLLPPEIEQLIAAQMPDLVRIRHDLHAHPQIGFEETVAARIVQEELGLAGVPFQANVATTGVVGWLIPEGMEGRDAVALRADMDALPLQEETGLLYASEVEGRMHACGHDGHVAILIGAARVLARLRERLPRPVKLVFQPAEEGLGGAKVMLDAGVLTEKVGRLKVGAIYALHGWPTLPVGTLGTRTGPLMAGADRFEIVIHGKGGHGAMPHRAVDPIVAAAQVVVALQTVVSRNIDPTAQAVVTVGQCHAGTAINIIPESATLAGTIRTLEDSVAEHVHRRLSAVAQHVAAGMGESSGTSPSRSTPRPPRSSSAASRGTCWASRPSETSPSRWARRTSPSSPPWSPAATSSWASARRGSRTIRPSTPPGSTSTTRRSSPE